MASFDPRADFARVADGLVPVTLHRPGTSLAAPVAHALPHAVTPARVGQTGRPQIADDVLWHLPADELPVAPRPGDVLVAGDGRRWTVLTVRSFLLGSRWQCECRDLVGHYGLDQAIVVEMASYGKSAQGQQEIAWHTWRTGLPAKIEPVTVETTSEHERPATVARCRIYCRENLQLDHRHRIRGPDGCTYRILGTRKADGIGAVLEIDVLREP
jgi:hypothetical protein